MNRLHLKSRPVECPAAKGGTRTTGARALLLTLALIAARPVMVAGQSVDAPKPLPPAVEQSTAQIARVDRIILNRIKVWSEDPEEDAYGRPVWTYSETCWWVFVDYLQLGMVRLPVNRGFNSVHGEQRLTPCTEGWMLELGHGRFVVARQHEVIESDTDWEMATLQPPNAFKWPLEW